MADEKTPEDRDVNSAEVIKRHARTEVAACGSVHSEPNEGAPSFDSSPPLPN